jgi:hypothetical protein
MGHREIQPHNEAGRMNIEIQISFADSMKHGSKNARVISERDSSFYPIIAH